MVSRLSARGGHAQQPMKSRPGAVFRNKANVRVCWRTPQKTPRLFYVRVEGRLKLASQSGQIFSHALISTGVLLAQ
jgi:hypothetical protein